MTHTSGALNQIRHSSECTVKIAQSISYTKHSHSIGHIPEWACKTSTIALPILWLLAAGMSIHEIKQPCCASTAGAQNGQQVPASKDEGHIPN